MSKRDWSAAGLSSRLSNARAFYRRSFRSFQAVSERQVRDSGRRQRRPRSGILCATEPASPHLFTRTGNSSAASFGISFAELCEFSRRRFVAMHEEYAKILARGLGQENT